MLESQCHKSKTTNINKWLLQVKFDKHKISLHRYNQNIYGISQISVNYTVAVLMNTDKISFYRQTHTQTVDAAIAVRLNLCLSAVSRVSSSH